MKFCNIDIKTKRKKGKRKKESHHESSEWEKPFKEKYNYTTQNFTKRWKNWAARNHGKSNIKFYEQVINIYVLVFFIAHFLLQFVENLTKILFLCKYSSQALNLIRIKLTLDMINRLAAFPGCSKLTPFFGSGPSMLNQFLTPFTFSVTWHIPLACRWLLDLWFIVKLFKKKTSCWKSRDQAWWEKKSLWTLD